MTIKPRGQDYPSNEIEVLGFAQDLELLGRPIGLLEDAWPPPQLVYLRAYLGRLGCKTVLVEHHYIDRDFIADLAAFYSRSLRDYPNYCQRVHFFDFAFTLDEWRSMVDQASEGKHKEHEERLALGYLGYVVIRPLPGYPVGRTVLKTYGEMADNDQRREFGCTRNYRAHLGPFTLEIVGLAFQQQDQGVSACATTAIWSAMHGTASLEGAAHPTPAEITQAASRYLLLTGRALPSGGLAIYQMCEAIRSAGFEPVLFTATNPTADRAQLLAYVRSGFPPILCLIPVDGSPDNGHAVCLTGVRLAQVHPQSDPKLAFREAAWAVTGLYVHDDRLGPYAAAEFYQRTAPNGQVMSALRIRWPDEKTELDDHFLSAVIVPVPTKVRLNVVRLREVGLVAADLIGRLLPNLAGQVILDSRYLKGVLYRRQAIDFGLTSEGNYQMQCKLALSRYLGAIELYTETEPIVDILVDATETRANPSVIACVVRSHSLDVAGLTALRTVAELLGAQYIA
jgi:hypothetical protein